MDKKKAVRTRIAPSPTGELHVGTARTALYNWLYARQNNGRMVLRLEDTDRSRCQPEFEKSIMGGLEWLGIDWDEGPDGAGDSGPYRQSKRAEIYREAVLKLLADGSAYRERGSEAIKFKVSADPVHFTDLIRGEITINPSTWGGDFIIARAEDDPVFHLAAVVDDAKMEISHVIRGEDHLTNTARHILLQQALGLERPIYAHLPLLLDEQRRKLSKRTGETGLLSYKRDGFLADAMVNYLALLGWNPGGDREFFRRKELIHEFDLVRVQKGGAIFSREKLVAFNKYYIRQMKAPELLATATRYSQEEMKDNFLEEEPGEKYWQTALKLEQDRAGTLRELVEKTGFFRPGWEGDYPAALLVWRKSTPARTVELLSNLAGKLEEVPDGGFTEKELESLLLDWIDENKLGRGDMLWPMRVGLTGAEHSPGPFEVSAVLGKGETLKRVRAALNKLGKDEKTLT